VPGKRFNSSLLADGNGYLFAFRNGWRGSEIYLGRLDAGLRPVDEPTKLDLWHPEANYGREDPRLFRFRGAVHVAFAGVVGGSRIRHTNVLYARLDGQLRVKQIFAPRYARRNPWEKNWSFFELDGRLYAVYAIAPHTVLAIDGERAELAHQTPTAAPWRSGAEMRGGTPPVRVGGEFWCVFHSKFPQPARGGRLRYEVGVYTFAAVPPFRVRRIAPEPLLLADPATCPPDQYCDCIFPCGAVRRGGDWVVSMGVHDRWTELWAAAHEEIERRLVAVTP
jgi:predicted GH43/DUF377 family glycosyl hydrolase